MMWVPQPCTVLQVTHTHSGHPWVPVLRETLLQGATARSADPLPQGRQLSLVHEVPRASITSSLGSSAFRLMNFTS